MAAEAGSGVTRRLTVLLSAGLFCNHSQLQQRRECCLTRRCWYLGKELSLVGNCFSTNTLRTEKGTAVSLWQFLRYWNGWDKRCPQR